MAKIKGKGTGPEQAVATAMSRSRLDWEEHARDLPGSPDFVFREKKVAVFIDGDFWHGWRFPQWRDKLSPAWEEKIAKNRYRDRLNYRRLRRMGWQVIRIWEHQIKRDLDACIHRILGALRNSI